MTTFIPTGIQACASKAGKTYWKIATNQGEATCFDYPIVQVIEANMNKPISMYDLETNEKGFINIRPAKPKPAQTQVPTNQPIVATQQDSFKEARLSKDVSMFTSYAKDIFIELMKLDDSKTITSSEMMKKAIDLIKQAKTSFERTEIFQDSNPKVVQTIQG
jgi:hypothetical protein